MSDEFAETPTPDPAEEQPREAEPEATGAGPAEADGPSAAEAWADVVTAMGELGDAVSRWARAATDNPENRRHLEDVRRGIDDMASKAATAFDSASKTDFGQTVKTGAEQTGAAIGDAAQKVGEAAAPAVASALAGLAGVFGRAAQRVDEATQRQAATPADATAAADDDVVDVEDEPAAPADAPPVP